MHGPEVCSEVDSKGMVSQLFERSILLPIPSSLTKRDEDDIIHAFQKVLTAIQ